MIRMLSTIMPVSLHGARAETTRIASSGPSRVCNCSAAPDAVRSMSSLSKRSNRKPPGPQEARTGAADEAVSAEHDHPARFLWSGIEVLEHDDFPYPFRAISSSSEACKMCPGFPLLCANLCMVLIQTAYRQPFAKMM